MAQPNGSTDDSVADAERLLEETASNPRSATSDVPRLAELLDDGFPARRRAADALVHIAEANTRAVEDEYPVVVDRLLRTEESLSIAAGLLDSAVDLIGNDVSSSAIVGGYRLSVERIEEELDDIAAETGAGDDTVPGNGATAVELAARLRDYADSVAGREQLVVEAAADGAEEIARLAARKQGLDAVDILVDLRAIREGSEQPLVSGISPTTGGIEDAIDADETIHTETLLQFFIDAMYAAALVLLLERSRAQVLRIQALLVERIP